MAKLFCAVKCGAFCVAGCLVDGGIPVADWYVAATGAATWSA